MAAERLGRLWAIVEPQDTHIQGLWFFPDKNLYRVLAAAAALREVYGASAEGKRLLKGGKGLDSLYWDDYETVIPIVGEAAFRLTKQALLQEQRLLRKLHADLNTDALSDQLHKAARAVNPLAEDLVDPGYGYAPRLGAQSGRLREARARLAPRVKEQNNPFLSTLFVHPQGVRILFEYKVGAADGRKMALSYVEDAVEAVADFQEELTQPGKLDRFWRYPGFVWLGVAELGLAEIPGFKSYAAAVGQKMVANPWERVFSIAGQALALLGVLFMFAHAVRALVAGVTAVGLVVAGADLGFAYMREREQDLGAKAFRFRKQGMTPVPETSFFDTAMAGAAALLAGIAYFQAGKEFKLLTGAGAEDLTGALKPQRIGVPGRPAPATGTASEARSTAVSPGARGAASDTRATTPDTRGATAETRASAPETNAATTGDTRATAPDRPPAAPGASPREDAVPLRKEPTTPPPKSARGTGEPGKPSSRGVGPSERSATPKVAAGRGVRDSVEAAERRVAELLTKENPDVQAVRDAVKQLVADLKRFKENEDLIKQLDEVLKGMESGKLIARVVEKVKAVAQRLEGVPPTELEKSFGLVDAESRAVAELLGLSPKSKALFRQTLPTDTDRNAKEFFEGFVAHNGEGWYVVDWQFGPPGTPPDHGAMTHMFQYLLIEEAFAEAGILSKAGTPLRAREFLVNLAGARGGVFTTKDKGKLVPISVGNQLFIELFDSTIASAAPARRGYDGVWGTPHRPETLFKLLRAEPLPELQ